MVDFLKFHMSISQVDQFINTLITINKKIVKIWLNIQLKWLLFNGFLMDIKEEKIEFKSL